MADTIHTDILILGAGIAGYQAFHSLKKRLRKQRSKKRITIVDQNNFFTFVPMLHEVATGSIEPTHAAFPLRELTHDTPHQFIRAQVNKIDPAAKQVHTERGSIAFEYCMIALGSSVNYFNTPGAREHSYHVRSLDAAMQLKHDFLSVLEDNPGDDIALTIVGGGYTGVEVAGQYCDLINKDVAKLYPEKQVTIRLIQADDTLVPHMGPRVQQHVSERLHAQNVEIMTGQTVSRVSKQDATLKDGQKIKSDITIWTAGFENVGPCYINKEHCERGRIAVDGQLRMPQYDHVYAIGDIAHITDPDTTVAYPQLAEAAHEEGKYVARHIARRLQRKTSSRFLFRSKGTLMPVGDWWGVAEIGPFTFFGRFAWWLRRTVYLMTIPGWLRKLRIVLDWTLHSFSFRHFINMNGCKTRTQTKK